MMKRIKNLMAAMMAFTVVATSMGADAFAATSFEDSELLSSDVNVEVADETLSIVAPDEKASTADGTIDAMLFNDGDSYMYAAKIFTAEEACRITGGSFYAYEEDYSTQIYLFTDLEMVDGEYQFYDYYSDYVYLDEDGYCEFDIRRSVDAGETFAVVVRYDADDLTGVPVTEGAIGTDRCYVSDSRWMYDAVDLEAYNYSLPINVNITPFETTEESSLSAPDVYIAENNDENSLSCELYDYWYGYECYRTSSVTLNWSLKAAVNKYEIVRFKDEPDGTSLTETIATLGATTRQYIDTDIVPGGYYYYCVRAINTTTGESSVGYSDDVIVPYNLAKPVVTVANVTAEGADLTWKPVGGADTYQIINTFTRTYSSGETYRDFDVIDTVSADQLSYRVMKEDIWMPSNGSDFQIAVVAMKNDIPCSFSTPATISFKSAPTVVLTATATQYAVTLKCSGISNTTTDDCYFYRRVAGTNDSFAYVGYSSDGVFVDTNIVPGTQYEYYAYVWGYGERYSQNYCTDNKTVTVPTGSLTAPVIAAYNFDSTPYVDANETGSGGYITGYATLAETELNVDLEEKDYRNPNSYDFAITWKPVAGATSYNIYRAPVSRTNGEVVKVGNLQLFDTVLTTYYQSSAYARFDYYYYVQAVNDDTQKKSALSAACELHASYIDSGNYNYVDDIYIVDAEATSTGVKLEWFDFYTRSSSYSYTIFRSLDGYAYEPVGETEDCTTLTFTDTTAKPGMKYYYSIAVNTGYWYNYWSEAITVTTAGVAKPAIISCTPSNGAVAVSWKGVTNATKYTLYSYLNGKYTLVGTTTNTVLTATGLSNGVKYGFVVRATVNGEMTAYSTADIVYSTPTTVVAKPVLEVRGSSNGSILLRWNKDSQVSKFSIYNYVGGKYKFVANTTSDSYKITGLAAGEYGYIVRAYSNGTWSAYTVDDVVYGTVRANTTTTTKPAVTDVVPHNGEVDVYWDGVSGAEKYNVYYYYGGKYALAGTTESNWLRISGLKNGIKYGYLVRAYVNGAWTSFSTSDLYYCAPVNTSAVITNAIPKDKKVLLEWEPVYGATKYNVYKRYNDAYSFVGTTTDTALLATGLTNDNEYGFVVRAYKNGAWTPYSDSDLVYATPESATPEVWTWTSSSNGYIELNWDRNYTEAEFVIYSYNEANGAYTYVGRTTHDYYYIYNVVPGKEYNFLVRAYVDGAYSSYTTDDIVSAMLEPYTYNISTYVDDYTDDTAMIHWNNRYGIEKFNIYSCDYYGTEEFTLLKTVDGDVRKSVITGLTPGTDYYITVEGVFADGTTTDLPTSYYYFADFTTDTNDYNPATTAFPFNCSEGNKEVTLYWDAYDGAEYYTIYRYNATTGKYTYVAKTACDHYIVKNLPGNVEYGFLVRAYINGKNTPYTKDDVKYATPYQDRNPIETVEKLSDTHYVIYFNDVDNAEKYRLYSYVNGKYSLVDEFAANYSTEYMFQTATAANYGFLIRYYANGVWSAYTAADVVYAS